MSQDMSFETCFYSTERLTVENLLSTLGEPGPDDAFCQTALSLLTPAVTRALPPHFQSVSSIETARAWVSRMMDESHFLVLQKSDTQDIIGFIFLFESDKAGNGSGLHLGYLLGEDFWGKGYANEFLSGLVEWCRKAQLVSHLIGGVDVGNSASIRLLEKNGFTESQEEGPEGVTFYELRF